MDESILMYIYSDVFSSAGLWCRLSAWLDIRPVKFGPLRRFETPGQQHPVTWHPISEGRRFQFHRCERLENLHFFKNIGSSPVGIATGLQGGQPTNYSYMPGRVRCFSVLVSIQNWPEGPPFFCGVRTGAAAPGSRGRGRECDHSPSI